LGQDKSQAPDLESIIAALQQSGFAAGGSVSSVGSSMAEGKA
jgi:hypothetical protein